MRLRYRLRRKIDGDDLGAARRQHAGLVSAAAADH